MSNSPQFQYECHPLDLSWECRPHLFRIAVPSGNAQHFRERILRMDGLELVDHNHSDLNICVACRGSQFAVLADAQEEEQNEEQKQQQNREEEKNKVSSRN
jgi:hypothetical protein